MGEPLLKIVSEGKGPGVTKEEWFKQLDTLIGSGEDINYQDRTFGFTALMEAVRMSYVGPGETRTGDIDTVIYLIHKGADVNIRRSHGQTALMDSVLHSSSPKFWSKYHHISKLLIEAGAEVNSMTWSERFGQKTLLMEALSHGCESEDIKMLVEAGADLDAQNINGETALIDAINGTIKDAWDHDPQDELILQNIKLLIDLGADINHQDVHGLTALMLALEGLRMFIDCEDSESDSDSETNTYTGIYSRFKVQSSVIAHILLEAGADVHIKDENGDNALIYAGRAEEFDVAKEILRNNYFEDKVYQEFLELVE